MILTKHQRVNVLHLFKVKRSLDIIFSLLFIILLLPFFFIVSIVVAFFLGSPVIFTQRRPGKNGKIFTLFKFRTMTREADENGVLLADDVRLTKIGRFLRATSLDELPELFNILYGDMSFIGPRPLLEEYLPLYSKEQSRRHEVTPGLTGLAQINGRNLLNWEDRFKLDVHYVDNWDLYLDFKILLHTIVKVFQREGIESEHSSTMPKFQGNK